MNLFIDYFYIISAFFSEKDYKQVVSIKKINLLNVKTLYSLNPNYLKHLKIIKLFNFPHRISFRNIEISINLLLFYVGIKVSIVNPKGLIPFEAE